MKADFKTAGTLAYDNLYAGETSRVTEKLVIAEGAGDLKRGAVLAANSAGKYVLVDTDAGDPGDIRRTPYAVLAHDADATSDDIEAMAYLSGHFNELALTFGGTDDADDHRAKLRELGIFLSKNMGA